MKTSSRNQPLFSPPALISYLSLSAVILYGFSLKNYFVGDDFTWLHWAADCHKTGGCGSVISIFLTYFTQASGFFYRPGTKMYFYLLYRLFGANQIWYHAASILIHIVNTSMLFFIAEKILKSRSFAFLTALLFVSLNVHSETLYWIASINHLAASFFVLSGLFFYIFWQERKRKYFLFLSLLSVFLSPLFHELGIVAPLLIIVYTLNFCSWRLNQLRKWYYAVYLMQIPMYLFLRYSAQSHWLSGDYNYSFTNLPFNIVGNTIGYIGLTLIGSRFLPLYEGIRVGSKQHLIVTFSVLLVAAIIVLSCIWLFRKQFKNTKYRSYLYAVIFFLVPLLPFLGLGNITYRYTYLASFGMVLFVIMIFRSALSALPRQQQVFGIWIIALLTLTFSYYNISELVRLRNDWKNAGEITKSVVTATHNVHANRITAVNVPIRFGEAWVFPVGFDDAVWLGSKKDVHVQLLSLQDFESSKIAMSDSVFFFDKAEKLHVQQTGEKK